MARKDKWAWVGIITALVLVTLYMGGTEDTGLPSSRSATQSGAKVIYLLLERLGYKVGRINKPYTQIPKDSKVILALQTVSRLTDDEREALQKWVREGGVLLYSFSPFRQAEGWDQLEEGRLGKGEIVWIFTYDMTNRAMIDEKNAYEQVREIGKYARPGEKVLFDDYHLAMHEVDVQEMPEQVKAGLWLLALCGLIAAYSRGRRFGAVRDEPDPSALRPGIEYVTAVGQLYKRANAPGVAAASLCRTFKRKLCKKLGMPADAETEDVVEQAEAQGMPKIAEMTKVLQRCDPEALEDQMEEAELVRVAKEIHDLEEELGIGAG